jgi:hypothetical protein
MNRGDWNLVRGMTDQYRIKWVIATFRPFKWPGTDSTVTALLQHEVEQLAPHLCHNFESACNTDMYLKPGGRLQQYLYLILERKTIPRLRHIIWLVSCPFH